MASVIHWDDNRLRLSDREDKTVKHVCFPRIPGLDYSDALCPECSLAGSITVMPNFHGTLHLLFDGIQPMATFNRMFKRFIPDLFTDAWFRVYISRHLCRGSERLHSQCVIQTCCQLITGGFANEEEVAAYTKQLGANDYYFTKQPLQSVHYVIFDPHYDYRQMYENYLDLINLVN